MHIIRIGDPCVTTNGIYVRMTLKILRNLIKCTEFDCIIGVEIVINIAGRVSEALVQTVGRSLIWFVYAMTYAIAVRSEEHTSELVTNAHLVCRLLLEKKKTNTNKQHTTHYYI